MKPWADRFYKSAAWVNTRNAYASSKHWLCERCNKPGGIVHHRIHLNPRNINNPSVALDWKNLELVCRECHGKEHEGVPSTMPGLRFDAQGELIQTGIPPIEETGCA